MIERLSKAMASSPVTVRLVWLVAFLAGTPVGCSNDASEVTTDLVVLRDGARVPTELPLQLGTFLYAPGTEPARVTFEVENLGTTAVAAVSADNLYVENDSALVFRLSRPRIDAIPAGGRAEFQVLVNPPAPGTWEATLVLDSPNAASGARRYRMTAIATTETVEPAPAFTFVDTRGAAVDALNLGYIAPGDSGMGEVRLRNDGNVPVTFAETDLVASDPTTPVTVAMAPVGELLPGAQTTLTFTATPAACGVFGTTFALQAPGGAETLAQIGIAWSSAPALVTVADVVASDVHDHWIAVASRAGGGLRAVIGDSADESFRGRALWLDFNGCETSAGLPLNESHGGSTNLWGHRVATDGTGNLALVTYADRAEAWLMPLGQQDGTPAAGYRLGTFNSKGGHGQGAGFARDGSVAVVGQTMADSGFNAHGGLWLYRRPTTTWDDRGEADFRLMPLEPPRVSDLGRAIAMSPTGDVIVGGGLYMSSVTVTDVFEAALFVWASSLDPTLGRTWGRLVPGQDGDRRAESFLLRSLRTPIEPKIAVGVSDDTSVLALAFKSDFTLVEVHIFEAGQDGLWGIPGDPATRRVANHVVSVDAFNEWGFALSPGGERFIVSDDFGIVSVARTGTDWASGSALADTWPTPLAGQITIDPSGKQLVGFGPDGDLVILQLDGEAP